MKTNNTEDNLLLPKLDSPVYPTVSVMPDSWECTALLHAFSPPPADDPKPTSPFFQLCLARITYIKDECMSAQLIGENYGSWWFKILPDNTTQLSVDQGNSWNEVDYGWTFPSTNWLNDSTCVGSSYLNWMEGQLVDWWKSAVPDSNASTWIWMNTDGQATKMPFRMMFGAPPKTPTKGSPKQLALFQMYSFTYLTDYKLENITIPAVWETPQIKGFQFGNVKNYKKFIWNSNFGMTTFMTPVDEKSNPLPTRVLYTWKPDTQYKVLTDRAQNTLMWYNYNPSSGLKNQEALMFGISSPNVSPPPLHSGSAFLIDTETSGKESCEKMPLGAEAPDWTYVKGVDGTIHACIDNNEELCPGNPIMIVSVIFPPTNEYPQGRYLWTWYSPTSEDGLQSRPVTFMESASNIAEGGTSLALADYFDYKEFPEWLPASEFEICDACLTKDKTKDTQNENVEAK